MGVIAVNSMVHVPAVQVGTVLHVIPLASREATDPIVRKHADVRMQPLVRALMEVVRVHKDGLGNSAKHRVVKVSMDKTA